MWHTIHNEKTDSEHSTCSQEPGVDSLPTFCLGTYLLELARSRNTRGESCCSDSGTESCQSSRSGMTSEHSTESRGEGLSMSSRVGFHARTSVRLARALDSMGASPVCTLSLKELPMRLDQDTCFWKTRQPLLLEDSTESQEDLPRWGMIADGVLLEATPPELPNCAREYGYLVNWPTPCAGSEKWGGTYQEASGSANWMRRTWIGRQKVNPLWWEWLMDWPMGWAGTKPLEMDRFHQWLHSHGKSYQIRKSDNANTQK